jgi:hypothetical protein
VPRRKHRNKSRVTLESIRAHDSREGDIVDLLIHGPVLDTTPDEDRFLVDVYQGSGLEFEVHQRMRQQGIEFEEGDKPWVEAIAYHQDIGRY